MCVHAHTTHTTKRPSVKREKTWFIADSSLRGYDGGRNVRDKERSVGKKKLVRRAESPSERGIAWPRWTGFRGMTVRDWLPIVGALLIPIMVALGAGWITWQQAKLEDQRA